MIDVAVDKPGATRVPLLAIALVEGGLKKAAMGMVAGKKREGLKRTCFQGQCTGAMEVVVESDVW